MTRRIVVPLNETARSERALPVAVAFARRLKVPLALVSVVTWPNVEHPGHPGYHETMMRDYPDVEAESVVVKTRNDIASAIRSVCGPDDIVCIGTDHTSAVAELFLHSIFFDIVRGFHGPVIAVGPHAVLPEAASRVLVCLDGHEHAEQGLDLVPLVVAPAGLEPVLVQVISGKDTAALRGSDSTESGYLHRLAHSVPSMNIEGWDVLHGKPVDSISDYADDPSVAAIAFTTDALDPVGRLISPSLANELVAKATRPLILLGSTSPMTVTRHEIPAAQNT